MCRVCVFVHCMVKSSRENDIRNHKNRTQYRNRALFGYRFDHTQEALVSLNSVMVQHGVQVSFFVDVPQIEKNGRDAQAHLAAHLGQFGASNWPFGDPRRRIYYDRCVVVGVSFLQSPH